jgi:hypothetical protein
MLPAVSKFVLIEEELYRQPSWSKTKVVLLDILGTVLSLVIVYVTHASLVAIIFGLIRWHGDVGEY